MNPWHYLAIPLGALLALGGLVIVLPIHRPTTRLRNSPARALFGLRAQLQRAGWGQMNPLAALALWLVLSIVGAFLVVVLLPIPALGVIAGSAHAFGGGALVRARISQRERRLRQAWPGVVDHLRQAVRSGASVSEAVQIAAGRVPDEISGAFHSFSDNLEQGVRVDQALATLKDRLANPIADRIIEALRMAHEVGGHALPTVLDALQASVRADISVREDALARQSWIRAASRLGAAAPWIVIVVLSGRPETIEAYHSPVGSLILFAGAGLTVMAYRMMSRLGRLPEDARWSAQ